MFYFIYILIAIAISIGMSLLVLLVRLLVPLLRLAWKLVVLVLQGIAFVFMAMGMAIVSAVRTHRQMKQIHPKKVRNISEKEHMS